MFSKIPGDVVQHVYRLLLGIGIVTSAALLTTLVILTERIDTQARDEAADRHRLLVEEWQSALSLVVQDYAYWTLAYDVITARDDVAVYENLGSGATTSDLFDWIFFIDADGMLIYAYGPQDVARPERAYDPLDFVQFISNLRGIAPLDYTPVDGFVWWNDNLFAVSAAWVTPDNLRTRPASDLPIMVGLKMFNAGALSRLGTATDARDLTVTRAAPARPTDAMALRGPDRPVAWLAWIPRQPGEVIRADVLPWMAIVCIALLALAMSAARYFRHLARLLAEATTLASTDQLTGLLNRAGLQAVLRTEAVKKAIASGHVAVISIDLNRFKQLNDAHGHKAGDMGLKVTAERLQSSVRTEDHVARLGGDEFLCLIMDPEPENVAATISRRLLDLSEAPITFDGFTQRLRLSVGIAVGARGIQFETLVQWSDEAMYWAKKRQSKDPAFYCRSMHGAQENLTDLPRSTVAG